MKNIRIKWDINQQEKVAFYYVDSLQELLSMYIYVYP
jgi:hypothetical protein